MNQTHVIRKDVEGTETPVAPVEKGKHTGETQQLPYVLWLSMYTLESARQLLL